MAATAPAKNTGPQAAMKTHLSQSTGIGAFDGQHGISPAIACVVSAEISDDVMSDDATPDIVIPSIIACSDAREEDAAAMAGRETGANAMPAIIRIASNRRMARPGFIGRNSHKWTAKESSSFLHSLRFGGSC